MQPAALPDTNVLAKHGRADGTDWAGLFDRMPQLPSFWQRWTVRRKSAVIEAVRGDWVPIEEICQLYSFSIDEFLAWEPGSAISIDTVFMACEPRATKSIVTPKRKAGRHGTAARTREADADRSHRRCRKGRAGKQRITSPPCSRASRGRVRCYTRSYNQPSSRSRINAMIAKQPT
jgi:hypothetical protein